MGGPSSGVAQLEAAAATVGAAPLAPALTVAPPPACCPEAFRFTDGSDAAAAAAVRAWRATHPREQFWPPQPGAATAAFASRLAADLGAAAVRVPIFTHQLLRAQYTERPFLNRALAR
jgi:hypothetical protein